MTWASFPYRPIAEQVCTPKELDVLRMTQSGASPRQISRIVGIDRRTVRDHLENAIRKIQAHPDYHEEQTA